MTRKKLKKSNYKNHDNNNINNFLRYMLVTIIILIFFSFYSEKHDLHFAIVNELYNNNIKNATSTTNANSPALETNGSGLVVYFFDVGQADCILVSNENQHMLIDAGNNSDGKLIVNYLKNDLQIDTLEYLIGTHNHEDHIGGLDDIIKNFDIKNLYIPYVSVTSTKTYENVEEQAIEKNLEIKNPKIGDTFSLGNAKIEVMNIDNDEPTNKNESSIVLELQFGTQKYLFTGDTETINENSRNWNKINVLKVAHHGSDTSSSSKFLEQTKPEIAIISVGPNNSYNLPKQLILDRIKNIGATIYRTDEHGTIIITSDGNKNEVKTLDVCLDGNSRK